MLSPVNDDKKEKRMYKLISISAEVNPSGINQERTSCMPACYDAFITLNR